MTRSAELRHWVSLPVAAASVVVAVTCASTARLSDSHAERQQPVVPVASSAKAPAQQGDAQPSPVSAEDIAVERAVSAAVAPAQATVHSDETLALGRFYAALRALADKKKREHVQVVWLGDSHTAADFWTDVVREELWQRFGAGGPGFVRVGLKAYRHSRATSERRGVFRIEPKPPSSRSVQGDGVFGLGGIRAVPESGAEVVVRAGDGSYSGDLVYTAMFRLSRHDRISIGVGEKHQLLTAQSSPKGPKGSPIAHLELPGSPGDEFSIRTTTAPELYGVDIEGSEPGVVLHTLGIDGARIATPLAWDEDAWVAELAAVAPNLVILSYGSNEVFDRLAPEKYLPQFKAVMARVRRAAPETDCLIVGPPDAADTNFESHPRVAEITFVQRRAAEELGCGFFSAAHAMGGLGSFSRWLHEKPPLAKADRVHLTPAGYRRLGKLLAQSLLEGFDQAEPAQSP